MGRLDKPHTPTQLYTYARVQIGALGLPRLAFPDLKTPISGEQDDKPKLVAGHGRSITVDNWQGKLGEFKRHLKRPDWTFRPGGQSGIEVSDLFPRVRSIVDDLCVIRSMATDHTNHYESTLGMHCGSWTFARPSIGAWCSYGLGTTNRNLPSFMVLGPRTPYAGAQTWGSDFLPGCHQGTWVVPGANPIPNLRPRTSSDRLQRLELELLGKCI